MASQLQKSRDRDRYYNKDRGESESGIKSMPFGKHKGVPLSDVPSHYIEWCLENIERDDIRNMLAKEMENRSSQGASSRPKQHVSKTKRSPEVNDDSATHYSWRDSSGFEHRIPKDVSMSGRECEVCPF